MPTDRQTNRKPERLFSLVIKTKVGQNVKKIIDRPKDRQNDRIAGQLKTPLVFLKY